MSRLRALLALSLALAALPAAAADPVAVGTDDDAQADLVAVSARGNATCATPLCLAASGAGDSSAGCRNATACADEPAGCGGFACVVVAVSALGQAESYAYCRMFGQVCVGVGLGREPELYYCRGDASGAVYCEGFL